MIFKLYLHYIDFKAGTVAEWSREFVRKPFRVDGPEFESWQRLVLRGWRKVKAVLLRFHTSPKSKPALELHSRAAPSVEAHHHSDGPDARRNSGGRRIIIKNYTDLNHSCSPIKKTGIVDPIRSRKLI